MFEGKKNREDIETLEQQVDMHRRLIGTHASAISEINAERTDLARGIKDHTVLLSIHSNALSGQREDLDAMQKQVNELTEAALRSPGKEALDEVVAAIDEIDEELEEHGALIEGQSASITHALGRLDAHAVAISSLRDLPDRLSAVGRRVDAAHEILAAHGKDICTLLGDRSDVQIEGLRMDSDALEMRVALLETNERTAAAAGPSTEVRVLNENVATLCTKVGDLEGAVSDIRGQLEEIDKYRAATIHSGVRVDYAIERIADERASRIELAQTVEALEGRVDRIEEGGAHPALSSDQESPPAEGPSRPVDLRDGAGSWSEHTKRVLESAEAGADPVEQLSRAQDLHSWVLCSHSEALDKAVERMDAFGEALDKLVTGPQSDTAAPACPVAAASEGSGSSTSPAPVRLSPSAAELGRCVRVSELERVTRGHEAAIKEAQAILHGHRDNIQGLQNMVAGLTGAVGTLKQEQEARPQGAGEQTGALGQVNIVAGFVEELRNSMFEVDDRVGDLAIGAAKLSSRQDALRDMVLRHMAHTAERLDDMLGLMYGLTKAMQDLDARTTPAEKEKTPAAAAKKWRKGHADSEGEAK